MSDWDPKNVSQYKWVALGICRHFFTFNLFIHFMCLQLLHVILPYMSASWACPIAADTIDKMAHKEQKPCIIPQALTEKYKSMRITHFALFLCLLNNNISAYRIFCSLVFGIHFYSYS